MLGKRGREPERGMVIGAEDNVWGRGGGERIF